MTDIVERLRDAASDLAVEAAEENERLAHELDKAHQLLSQHFGWLRDLEITKAKQAQEIEKLRAQLKRTNDALDKEFNNGIALCDAIERLKAEFELFREAPSKLEVAQYEIERLRAVIMRAKDALLDGQSTQRVHDLLVAALLGPKP